MPGLAGPARQTASAAAGEASSAVSTRPAASRRRTRRTSASLDNFRIVPHGASLLAGANRTYSPLA